MKNTFKRVIAMLMSIILLIPCVPVFAETTKSAENDALVLATAFPSKNDGFGKYFVIAYSTDGNNYYLYSSNNKFYFINSNPGLCTLSAGPDYIRDDQVVGFTTAEFNYWTWDSATQSWVDKTVMPGVNTRRHSAILMSSQDLYECTSGSGAGGAMNYNVNFSNVVFAKNSSACMDTDIYWQEKSIVAFLLQRLGIVGDSLTSAKALELFESAMTSTSTSWSSIVSESYDAETGNITIPKNVMVAFKDKVVAFVESDSGYKIIPKATIDAETLKAALQNGQVTYNGNKVGRPYDTNWVAGDKANLNSVFAKDLITTNVFYYIGYREASKYIVSPFETAKTPTYYVYSSNKLLFYDELFQSINVVNDVAGQYNYFTSSGMYNMDDLDVSANVVTPTTNNFKLFYRFADTTPIYNTLQAVKDFANGDAKMYYRADDLKATAQAVTISPSLLETNWINELGTLKSKAAAAYSANGWKAVNTMLTGKANFLAQLADASIGGDANMVTVTAEVPEVYTVTVPKTIVMGAEQTKTMNILVRGALAPKRILALIIPNEVTLTETNSYVTEAATVNVNKASYKANEVFADSDVTSVVTITRPGKTPGEWMGNFIVNVALNYE